MSAASRQETLEKLVESAICRVAAKMCIDVHPRILSFEDAERRGWNVGESRTLRIVPVDLEEQLADFFSERLVTDVALYTVHYNDTFQPTEMVFDSLYFTARPSTYEEQLADLEMASKITIRMGYIGAPESV